MTPIERLLSKLKGVKKSENGWSARCPAHEDRKASLSFAEGIGGLAMVKCHAGCSVGAIVSALGMTVRDLMADRSTSIPIHSGKSKMTGKVFVSAEDALAELENRHGKRSSFWTYHDAHGEPVGLVVRWDRPDGKDIRPVTKFGNNWRISAMPDPRPLYRLPDLANSKFVIVTEGEKSADAARSIGFVATTSAGGSQAANKSDWSSLAGKEVWILPDNDAPGRNFARAVASILAKLTPACVVRIVELNGLPEKGDIVDWIAAHGDSAEPETMRAEIETYASAAKRPEQDSSDPPVLPSDPDWPAPLALDAFHGTAGRFVRIVEPHTEADSVALLVSFLLAVGNAIGRTRYVMADGSRHYTNEFAVIVGQSSKARKGTSWSRVVEVVTHAAQEWVDTRVKSGLSSGEGLIYNVRDPVEGREAIRQRGQPTQYETIVTDEGESDKRLLLVESEFANVLKQTERNGNTLSTTIRDAWDKDKLSPLTKNSPIVATNPHISIIGHITREELQRYLTATESANGFGNRFVWVLVRRSKLLPFGGRPDEAQLASISQELGNVLVFANSATEMRFDADACTKWVEVYPVLSRDRFGLAGNLAGRAEAHVLRLAIIYAALDRSTEIRTEHLSAALAVWEFSERSVTCIFGDATGNPLADELLRLLRTAGSSGMTRTELQEATGRNLPASRLGQALNVVRLAGLARTESRETGGRPAEVWIAFGPESRGS